MVRGVGVVCTVDSSSLGGSSGSLEAISPPVSPRLLYQSMHPPFQPRRVAANLARSPASCQDNGEMKWIHPARAASILSGFQLGAHPAPLHLDSLERLMCLLERLKLVLDHRTASHRRTKFMSRDDYSPSTGCPAPLFAPCLTYCIERTGVEVKHFPTSTSHHHNHAALQDHGPPPGAQGARGGARHRGPARGDGRRE